MVLVEAERLGRGVSGHTTAKVSSQHGLKYASLRSMYGPEAAATYGQANQVALEWMAGAVEDDGIDCDFRRRPAFTYVPAGESTGDIEDEVEPRPPRPGCPPPWTTRRPCPTRWPPRSASTTRPSSTFASTWARWWSSSPPPAAARSSNRGPPRSTPATPCLVQGAGRHGQGRNGRRGHPLPVPRPVAGLRPRAPPALLRGRSAGSASRRPQGMFLSASSPTRSIRSVPVDGDELLLGRRPGPQDRHRGRHAASATTPFAEFADEHWGVESVEYQWSSQDNSSIDELPLIGSVTPFDPEPADGHRASPSGGSPAAPPQQ